MGPESVSVDRARLRFWDPFLLWRKRHRRPPRAAVDPVGARRCIEVRDRLGLRRDCCAAGNQRNDSQQRRQIAVWSGSSRHGFGPGSSRGSEENGHADYHSSRTIEWCRGRDRRRDEGYPWLCAVHAWESGRRLGILHPRRYIRWQCSPKDSYNLE